MIAIGAGAIRPLRGHVRPAGLSPRVPPLQHVTHPMKPPLLPLSSPPFWWPPRARGMGCRAPSRGFLGWKGRGRRQALAHNRELLRPSFIHEEEQPKTTRCRRGSRSHSPPQHPFTTAATVPPNAAWLCPIGKLNLVVVFQHRWEHTGTDHQHASRGREHVGHQGAGTFPFGAAVACRNKSNAGTIQSLTSFLTGRSQQQGVVVPGWQRQRWVGQPRTLPVPRPRGYRNARQRAHLCQHRSEGARLTLARGGGKRTRWGASDREGFAQSARIRWPLILERPRRSLSDHAQWLAAGTSHHFLPE